MVESVNIPNHINILQFLKNYHPFGLFDTTKSTSLFQFGSILIGSILPERTPLVDIHLNMKRKRVNIADKKKESQYFECV